MASLLYAQLTRTHPEYDAEGWAVADLLYAGGKRLKSVIGGKRADSHDSEGKAKCLVDRLFPRHVGEEDMVYDERRKRAFDIPYPGQIVDGIVAAVFSDDFTVELDEKPLPDESYWHEFVEDVSPPGGERIPLRTLLREQMRTAQKKRVAWTLVDMPARDGVTPANLYEEESAGLLDAYAVALDPACVINWSCNRAGELEWAVVRYLDSSQRSLDEDPGTVHAEYTVYTRIGWRRWAFSYVPGKSEPRDKDPIDTIPGVKVTDGLYGFGKVPLVRHELPDGLWSMGKIEPLAIELLNKENAVAWGEYRSIFGFVAYFMKPRTGEGDASAAARAAMSQRVGPGRGVAMQEGEDIKVIASPTEPIVAGREGANRKRDEMFRVVDQMSKSVDQNTAASKTQSGESKKESKKGETLLYLALGELVREWGRDILDMAKAGRGEDVDLKVRGMDTYDDVSLEALVNQESVVETIPVRSQTFQVMRQKEFARRYLGSLATPEVMEKIGQELEANISPEEFAPIVNQDPTKVDEDGEPLPAPPPPVHGPKAKPPRGMS